MTYKIKNKETKSKNQRNRIRSPTHDLPRRGIRFVRNQSNQNYKLLVELTWVHFEHVIGTPCVRREINTCKFATLN